MNSPALQAHPGLVTGGICKSCSGYYAARKGGKLRWHHVGRRIRNPRRPGSDTTPIPMSEWFGALL